MMKLALMKQFYHTLEDGVNPILEAIASRWFTSPDIQMVRASANFVAKVMSGERVYYLRLNHESERSVQHIENELAYIQHITSHGINANNPEPSIEGQLVESLETELGVFNAVMFNEIKGKHIESNELDLNGYANWGASLGEIHNASHGFELDGAPEWRDHLDLVSQQVPYNKVLGREASIIRDMLSRFSRENYGLVVFDFEMDNIKWASGTPGFMDFDDFCVHWYAADIVYALRDLHGDKITMFNPADERVQAFIRGYRGVRAISKQELGLFPVFIRLHNLYFYARIHRANTGVSNSDPEWVKRLNKRLKEKNEYYLKDITENPLS